MKKTQDAGGDPLGSSPVVNFSLLFYCFFFNSVTSSD